MKEKSGSNIALVAMVSAAVGAIAALLFAPKSGEELRGDIKNKAREAKEKTKDKAREAKDKAADVKDKAVNKARDAKDRVQEES